MSQHIRGMAVLLASALFAGCTSASEPVDSTEPVDISPVSSAVSVSEVTETSVRPFAPGDDLFAWAHYSRKYEELDIEWIDEADTDSYRIYSGDVLLGEADSGNSYTCSIPMTDLCDEMTFRVERIKDGESSGSTDIHMHRNDKGGLSLDGHEADSDGDGLTDLDEARYGTKRFEPDTDGDGLSDGYEYRTSSTDPLKRCSLGSEIDDGVTDFEKDGLSNIEECENGTGPYNGDTDEDGFPDGYEVHNGMDPLTPDDIVIDRDKAESIKDLDKHDIELMNSEIYLDPDRTDDIMGYISYEICMGTNDYGYLEGISSRYYEEPIENARDALYSLYALRTLTGIHDPEGDLVFSGSHIDKKFDRYMFEQIYKGVPVYSHMVYITIDKPDGDVDLESFYIPTEVLDMLDMTPSVTEEDLFGIALQNASRLPERLTGTKLYIFAERDREPYLGYLVYTDQREYLYIDAHTGEVTDRGNTYYD
ncbi:MAG: hypothetical protein IKR73_08265 [Oscillospiraceae bacterium]|nr:hypothetical protein [Oscillospiraceae bacterium]